MKRSPFRFDYVLIVLTIFACGCFGPERSYNVSLQLVLPNVIERGQTVKSICSAYGSEYGRFTVSWFVGTVDVEIDCPEGIQITPSQMKLEMKRGEGTTKRNGKSP